MKNKQLILIGLAIVALLLGAFIIAEPNLQTENTNNSQEITNVLNTPPQDASREEKQEHFQLALSMAEEADFLDISGCEPKPLVLSLKESETFSVKNTDSIPHVIRLSAETAFTIEANGTTELKADFEHGPGMYGYGCDDGGRTAGLFIVNP